MKEGLESLVHAEQLDPGYAPAHAYHGVILASLGRPDLAGREFETCLRIDPNNAVGRRGRASLNQTGNRKPGCYCLVRMVQQVHLDLPETVFNGFWVRLGSEALNCSRDSAAVSIEGVCQIRKPPSRSTASLLADLIPSASSRYEGYRGST